MSTSPGDGVAPAVPPETEALRQEIEVTRAELGETVQALAARADVKGRVRAGARDVAVRADELRHEVVVRADELRHDLPVLARQWSIRVGRRVRENPTPYAAGLAGLIAALVLLRWRRSR